MKQQHSDPFDSRDSADRPFLKPYKKSDESNAKEKHSAQPEKSNAKEIGAFWKQVLRWKQTPGDIDDLIFSEDDNSSKNISER